MEPTPRGSSFVTIASVQPLLGNLIRGPAEGKVTPTMHQAVKFTVGPVIDVKLSPGKYVYSLGHGGEDLCVNPGSFWTTSLK